MAEYQVDSVGPFLKTMQRRKAANQPSGKAERADGPAVVILVKLAERGATPVTELLAETKLNFADFARDLQTLTDLGFITVSQVGGEEIAELTPSGRVLAESSVPGSS